MCPDSYLVCMYGGDRVLVRCGLVSIASTHPAMHLQCAVARISYFVGLSFLVVFHIGYVEVVYKGFRRDKTSIAFSFHQA